MPDKVINLFPKQQQAFLAQNRFIACIAGIQSGKTLTGACWVQKKLQETEGDGLIVANDYKMLDQSTLPKLFEVNPVLRRYYKQQRGLIELPNKKRIYIRSAENPQALEGFTIAWNWLDEAGKYKLDAWINIQARGAVKRAQSFITTTPDTMNWLYYDFYDRFLKGDTDYLVVQWKSEENPYFPKEEYERAKKTFTPATFRRRYEGTFEQMEGLVYQLLPQDVMAVPHPPPQTVDVIAGVDFGFTNPNAVSVVKLTKDGIFHICAEHYKDQETTNELIEVCKNLRDIHKITKFYPDPAEPDRIEEMKRAGIYVREVKKDILQGISDVQNLLHQGKLKVYKSCRHTIEEFSTYHFETPTEDKNYKELPHPANNHLMDALRYALSCYSYVPPREKTYNYRPQNKRTGY